MPGAERSGLIVRSPSRASGAGPRLDVGRGPEPLLMNRFGIPDLGVGIGLRPVHFGPILATEPKIDWFEVLSENYLDTGGRPLYMLDRVVERYPVAMHGVSLSVGSTDPLDRDYLRKLKGLAERTRAHWVSDHLCWTGVVGRNTHDLLPLPYDEATLRHVIGRVREVQEVLERPLVLENPSTYLAFASSNVGATDFQQRFSRTWYSNSSRNF